MSSWGDSETHKFIIAKFNPSQNQWSKIGILQVSRYAFGVIEIDNKFLVMGGEDDKPTKICELKNEKNEVHFKRTDLVSSDDTKNC